MGTSRSVGELVVKFDRLAAAVPRAAKSATNAAALAAKDEYVAGLRGVGITVGVTRMPRKKVGTGAPGVPVRVNYQMTHIGGAPAAIIRPRGPVHWFESGTKRHAVLSIKAGRSRKGRVKLGTSFSAPGDGVGQFRKKPDKPWLGTPFGARAWVQHPGMRARPWFRGVERRVIHRTPLIYQAALDRALIQSFAA